MSSDLLTFFFLSSVDLTGVSIDGPLTCGLDDDPAISVPLSTVLELALSTNG